ncbi:MAG: hypothetical protein E7290_03190 [Lachnospiraceae bacterium]|nr:hypothetical protein [Lachnospiraceae bacterium]
MSKSRVFTFRVDIWLVAEKDLYHLECQMTNDSDMVVRMIEYDFHTALRHGIQMDAPNVFTLHFPNSTVLYPQCNNKLPDKLICNVIFPDGSNHRYEVPTIRIQKYSLEDIREKHLTMFIPFKLLSFRPRVNSKRNPIQENELTEYVKRLILILEEEYEAGNISSLEYKDYVKFINLAAERVFHSQQYYAEEVFEVTKSVLELPSDIYRKAEMAEKLQQELKEREEEFFQREEEFTKREEEFALQREEFSQREEEFARRIAQLEAQLKAKEE